MALEYKYKPTKINTVLTTVTIERDPVYDQEKVIASWKASNRTIVFGRHSLKDFFGLMQISTRGEAPLLREVIGGYLMQIPGGETAGLCDPNIAISEDPSKLYEWLSTSRFERSWGSYCKLPGQIVPSLFVFDAPVLAHMIHEIPYDLPMVGGAITWQSFVHSWFEKRIPPHKYKDISEIYPISKISHDETEPIHSEEPTKKKAGRPKKNAA